jgi:hypothetical protein
MYEQSRPSFNDDDISKFIVACSTKSTLIFTSITTAVLWDPCTLGR